MKSKQIPITSGGLEGKTAMRQEIKALAEYYAFQVVTDIELLDECENIEEAKKAFRYAKKFGDEYNEWIDEQKLKHEELN